MPSSAAGVVDDSDDRIHVVRCGVDEQREIIGRLKDLVFGVHVGASSSCSIRGVAQPIEG